MLEKQLLKKIYKETKKSFISRKDDQEKPINNVANNGLAKGEQAYVKREGEYHGITVEALEEVKPLLTDFRVHKAVKKLVDGNVQGAASVLHLTKEVSREGVGVLYQVLKIWLEKNDLEVPQEYLNKAVKIKSKQLKDWVLRVRSDPIEARLKIVSVGRSKKGNPVVPENWVGREFDNARDLHSAIDGLDWRVGKPAVNYCCIHSMWIKEVFKWTSLDNIKAKNVKWGG